MAERGAVMLRRTIAGVAHLGLVGLVGFVGPASALAASPSPGSGGDTRSSGEGAGLVGEPLLAIGLVVLIAVISVIATIAYVRLTTARTGDRRRP